MEMTELKELVKFLTRITLESVTTIDLVFSDVCRGDYTVLDSPRIPDNSVVKLGGLEGQNNKKIVCKGKIDMVALSAELKRSLIGMENVYEVGELYLAFHERLNAYYVDSVREIVNAISSLNNNPRCLMLQEESRSNNLCLSKFSQLKVEDVEKIVKAMNNVMGSNGISTKMLKDMWSGLGNRVTKIVNESLRRDRLSNILKISTIVPISKVKDNISYSDLRLHSTESALQLVVDDWRQALDRGEVHSCGVY
ncbi:hypothetical protein ILUMI_24392 [Ignelater luminosus]|uniref:Uncharacterized protein n=1 Tax=Ignelater luminosus TaxID=2038154 RepID=A0A8K0CAK7_IGNLU|nr:hypothetical protein ILUMI_24392 [Ignelater luminosus]